jgi:hypothetical protein
MKRLRGQINMHNPPKADYISFMQIEHEVPKLKAKLNDS